MGEGYLTEGHFITFRGGVLSLLGRKRCVFYVPNVSTFFKVCEVYLFFSVERSKPHDFLFKLSIV